MILVTGGTGLLGAHLLYKLSLKGEKIRAIYRNQTKLAQVKKVFSYYTQESENLFKTIEWVQTDITNIPELDKTFKDITHVYHCAANLSFNPKDYKISKASNIKGTANIVNLCLIHNIKKLCHVSSIATLGESPKEITEETYWNPENNKHNIYAITKYGAELEVWRGTQEGLNTVIVNPGVIIGPGFWDSGTGAIFKKANNGFNYFTEGETGVIDVNDVTSVMITLMERADLNNERYILVSENISYQNLLQEICSSLNKQIILKKATKKQLQWYMFFDRIKASLTNKSRSIFKPNVISAFKKLHYNNSKIKQVYPNNFKPIKQSINETAAFFLSSD